jgi:hypothetical protein
LALLILQREGIVDQRQSSMHDWRNLNVGVGSTISPQNLSRASLLGNRSSRAPRTQEILGFFPHGGTEKLSQLSQFGPNPVFSQELLTVKLVRCQLIDPEAAHDMVRIVPQIQVAQHEEIKHLKKTWEVCGGYVMSYRLCLGNPLRTCLVAVA